MSTPGSPSSFLLATLCASCLCDTPVLLWASSFDSIFDSCIVFCVEVVVFVVVVMGVVVFVETVAVVILLVVEGNFAVASVAGLSANTSSTTTWGAFTNSKHKLIKMGREMNRMMCTYQSLHIF